MRTSKDMKLSVVHMKLFLNHFGLEGRTITALKRITTCLNKQDKFNLVEF